MLKNISGFILDFFGWKTCCTVALPDKCVLIGAPHTTNWDFPLTLLALYSLGIQFSWVAKHSLFFWPLGSVFRRIGGIPVDRSSGSSFLKKTIDLYKERDTLVLAIAPEGTRGKTTYWKTGFYTIAHYAEVPIVLGYMDYPQKKIGIEALITPSGDIEEDFRIISAFYHGKKGKYPEKQGEIRIKVRKKKEAGN